MANLTMWLDATNEDSLKTSTVATITTASFGGVSDGDPISVWKDSDIRRESGIEAIPVADGNRPYYVKDGINGLPSLNFDSDYLRGAITPIKEGSTGYTIIVVFEPNSTTVAVNDYAAIYNQRKLDGSTPLGIGVLNPAGGKDFYFGGFIGSVTLPDNPAVQSKPYILIARVRPSDSGYVANLDINGTNYTASTTGDLSMRASTHFQIATNWTSNTDYFKGLISEVIVFDRGLKNSEVDSINSYLSQKYGINI